MNARVQPREVLIERRLPLECIALVLQGGGALGAYQAGVYAGLAEADIDPDWVAGISIGAINAAIVAGNPPETRVDRLREVLGAGDHGRDPLLAGQSRTCED
jgi:NTE family protein